MGEASHRYPFEVGRAFTLVDTDELTPSSVDETIRDGRVEAVVDGRRIDRFLQRGYREIHRRKHPTDVLTNRSPGIGEPPGDG